MPSSPARDQRLPGIRDAGGFRSSSRLAEHQTEGGFEVEVEPNVLAA